MWSSYNITWLACAYTGKWKMYKSFQIFLKNSNHWHCKIHTSCDAQMCSITVTLSNFIPNKKTIMKHIFKCCFRYNKFGRLGIKATSIILCFVDVDAFKGNVIIAFLPLHSVRRWAGYNFGVKYCFGSKTNCWDCWNDCIWNVCKIIYS